MKSKTSLSLPVILKTTKKPDIFQYGHCRLVNVINSPRLYSQSFQNSKGLFLKRGWRQRAYGDLLPKGERMSTESSLAGNPAAPALAPGPTSLPSKSWHVEGSHSVHAEQMTFTELGASVS